MNGKKKTSSSTSMTFLQTKRKLNKKCHISISTSATSAVITNSPVLSPATKMELFKKGNHYCRHRVHLRCVPTLCRYFHPDILLWSIKKTPDTELLASEASTMSNHRTTFHKIQRQDSINLNLHAQLHLQTLEKSFNPHPHNLCFTIDWFKELSYYFKCTTCSKYQ